MPDFKVRYEVNDGYAGGSEPQTFRIREGDYDFHPGMTEEQILELFYDAVDEDMRQRISFHNVNHSDFLEWARSQIEPEEGTP